MELGRNSELAWIEVDKHSLARHSPDCKHAGCVTRLKIFTISWFTSASRPCSSANGRVWLLLPQQIVDRYHGSRNQQLIREGVCLNSFKLGFKYEHYDIMKMHFRFKNLMCDCNTATWSQWRCAVLIKIFNWMRLYSPLRIWMYQKKWILIKILISWATECDMYMVISLQPQSLSQPSSSSWYHQLFNSLSCERHMAISYIYIPWLLQLLRFTLITLTYIPWLLQSLQNFYLN